jgi:hypothetical protein
MHNSHSDGVTETHKDWQRGIVVMDGMLAVDKWRELTTAVIPIQVVGQKRKTKQNALLIKDDRPLAQWLRSAAKSLVLLWNCTWSNERGAACSQLATGVGFQLQPSQCR